MSWKKISDELPPINEEVLFFDNVNGVYIGITWENYVAEDDEEKYFVIRSGGYPARPEFWQKLPDAPY